MSMDQVKFKMLFLFPGAEGRRVRVNIGEDGMFTVTVDVHGMSVIDAKRAINNVIAMMRVAFHLCIIHGYQHGTKIKEMLYQSFANARVTGIHCASGNPGLSICNVAALC